MRTDAGPGNRASGTGSGIISRGRGQTWPGQAPGDSYAGLPPERRPPRESLREARAAERKEIAGELPGRPRLPRSRPRTSRRADVPPIGEGWVGFLPERRLPWAAGCERARPQPQSLAVARDGIEGRPAQTRFDFALSLRSSASLRADDAFGEDEDTSLSGAHLAASRLGWARERPQPQSLAVARDGIEGRFAIFLSRSEGLRSRFVCAQRGGRALRPVPRRPPRGGGTAPGLRSRPIP
jgi:hypothetical protein